MSADCDKCGNELWSDAEGLMFCALCAARDQRDHVRAILARARELCADQAEDGRLWGGSHSSDPAVFRLQDALRALYDVLEGRSK